MTVLSPLARGRGTWQGNLESTHPQPVPVMKPHLVHDPHTLSRNLSRSRSHVVRVGKDGHFLPPRHQDVAIDPDSTRQLLSKGLHNLSPGAKASSQSSYRHQRARSESTAECGDGRLDLPKTYLTRRGALVLFAGPKNMAFSKEDQEKYYLYDPEDVADQSALKEMGTLDKLTASVFQYVNQQQIQGKLVSPTRNGKAHTLSSSLGDADLRTQPGADFRFYLKDVQSQANFRNLFRSPSFQSLLVPATSHKRAGGPPTTLHPTGMIHRDSPSTQLGVNGKITTGVATDKDKEDGVKNVEIPSRASTARSSRSSTITPLSLKEITSSIKSAPYHGRPLSASLPAAYTPFIPTPPSSLRDAPYPCDVDRCSSGQSPNAAGSSPRLSAWSHRSLRRPSPEKDRDDDLTSDSAGHLSATSDRFDGGDSPPPSGRASAHSLHGTSNIMWPEGDVGMEGESSSRLEIVRSPEARQRSPGSGRSRGSRGSLTIAENALVGNGEVYESRVTPRSRRGSLISAGSRMSKGVSVIEDVPIDPGRDENVDDGESDWKSEIIDLGVDGDEGWGVEQNLGNRIGVRSGMEGENASGNVRRVSMASALNSSRIYTPKTQSSGRTTPSKEYAADGIEINDNSGRESEGRKNTSGASSRHSQRVEMPVVQISGQDTPLEGLDAAGIGDAERQLKDTEVMEQACRASSGDSREMYILENRSLVRTTPLGEEVVGSGEMVTKDAVEEGKLSSRASSADVRNTDARGSHPSERSTPHREPVDPSEPQAGLRSVHDCDIAATGVSCAKRADQVDDGVHLEGENMEVPLSRSSPGLLLEETISETVVPVGGKQPIGTSDTAPVGRQDTLKAIHLGKSSAEFRIEESGGNIGMASVTTTLPESSVIRGADRPLKNSSTVEPPELGKKSGTATVFTVPPESSGTAPKHHQPSSPTTNLASIASPGHPKSTKAVVAEADDSAASKKGFHKPKLPDPRQASLANWDACRKDLCVYGTHKGRKSPVRGVTKKTSFTGPQFEYIGSVAIDPYAPKPSKRDMEEMVAGELAKDLAAQNLLEDKSSLVEECKDEVDSLATDDEAIEAELKNTRPTTSSKKKENRKKLAKEKAALREARRAEKQRRKEEMEALREKKRLMEEERRKNAAEERRRQEELAEKIAEAEQEAEMARQAEEDARLMMQEARRLAREERDTRRKEDAEKRRLEREKQKEERKKMEESARQREKEMADRLASAEERRAAQEAARLERERLEQLEQDERDRLEEEELNRQEMEEERIREMERQAEREAVERLVHEREAAEENRRQAELLMGKKREEEERRRQEEQEQKAKEEARLLLLKLEEEQRWEREQEKIRQIQRIEEEARAKVCRELSRRRAVALRRRERNLEQRGHMNGLRRTQGTTKPWVFTYYVHWPRDSYERRLPTGEGEKGRRPRAKTAPPQLTVDPMALVTDSASGPQ